MYGRRHSEEAKQKIAENMLGEKHWAYGKHFSEDHRRKIGEAQIGEKGNHWRGGSRQKYVQGWQRIADKIRERDIYHCVLCGMPEKSKKKIVVHHINYNKKDNIPNNLVTVCWACHLGKIHLTVDNEQMYEVALSTWIEQRYGELKSA